jgi:hypothetical protein
VPNSAVVLQSELHDYAPYGQVADSTALDTAIMAKTPWGYWKFADTAGNFADSSGNVRHATAELDPGASLRGMAPINAKGSNCVYLANGRIGMPLVQSHLGAQSGVYTYIGMIKFHEIPAAGSAVGNRYQGSVFLFQASEGSGTNFDVKLSVQDVADGSSLIIQSGTNILIGHAGVMVPGKVYVVALVGMSLPGNTWAFDVWVNGVKLVTAMPRYNASGAGSYLSIGRLGSTTRLASFWASNWAAWNRQLSNYEIMDLTECYLTKADYAASWMPR